MQLTRTGYLLIVQLQVGKRRARPIGRMQGKGHLTAAPFITRRGLTLPLDDGDGNLLVREQSADVLGPPQESGALWPLQP